MSNKLLFRLAVLVAAMMCALGAAAAEAYANYTSSNGTLTFYYDNYRSSCTGPTYDLNQGTDMPAWYTIRSSVTRVVFNSSFANARPISTYCWFSMMSNLRTITGLQYLNTSYVTNMAAMFSGCSSLTSLNMNYSTFYTGKVTDMSDMFSGCSALTSLDVGILITTNVTNMTSMFSGCSNLTSLVLTGFSTAKVTDMSKMFQNCSRLVSLDMTGFNTMRVTNMSYMFSGCSSLPSVRVSFFITANVRDMSYMFDGCRALTTLDVTDFNTAKVTNMSRMFNNCNNLTSLDLGRFNTALVTNMSYMFQNCSYLTTIYAGDNWSTAAVTSSSGMFSGCTRLVGGKGTTYNSSHVDAAYAHIDGGPSNPGYFSGFEKAYALYTPDNTTLTFYYDEQRDSRPGTPYDLNTGYNIPEWYTDGTNSSVTRVVFDLSFAFASPTSSFYWFADMSNLQSITGMEYLNTSNVTNMGSMFYDCSGLTSLDLGSFTTSNVTNMSNMFRGCSGLTSLDVSNFNTAKVTDIYAMFYDCSGLTSLDVSHFNTAKVTDMSNMFRGCSGLTSLDVSQFNTANVTNMSYMFAFCSGLTSLDVSSFNTAKVTNMSYMFIYCSGLTSLDLSSFNTAKVTNMEFMFYRSSNLTSICVDNAWSTDAVTQSDNMFNGCTSLIGFRGTTYDPNYTDKTYAHIDGGPSNPGYLDKKVLQAYACYTPENTTLTFYYDYQRSLRPGTTYNLNTGINHPGWYSDGTNSLVTLAVFDPSFADALPTSTFLWFGNMSNLQSITGMEYLNTSNVTNTESMFYYCSGLTSLDVSHFNTAKVTDMSYMFSLCSGLTRLDLSNFNTVNVTRMVGMFSYCTGLTSLDLSSFNTVNVGSMYSMFFGCSSLTSLDLSNFNTAAVTKMDHMFSNCPGLTTIYVDDGWSTAAVTESSDMFKNCTSLVGGMGTTYDPNHVDGEYAHIDGGSGDPGYFTAKAGGQHGDVNGDGIVNISDATALINLLLSASALPSTADINQDGIVNISDATALINFLLGGNWN